MSASITGGYPQRMPTRMTTCPVPCGGEILPSYIGPAPITGAQAAKGDMTYPATCQQCGKTYADVISLSMTVEDLAMVRDRLSESTRQELMAAATELTPGQYQIEIVEERARDFASKAANLGLVVMAGTVRQELNNLAAQRRSQFVSR